MYIVFEGIDGAGKTSMAKWLKQDLKRYTTGLEIYDFHQPGSTGLGDKLRVAVKDKDVDICGYAQFYMMLADHSQFVEENLKPIFTERPDPSKYVIVQDRHSAISGYAFQLYANKLDHFSYDVNYGAPRFKPYQPDVVVMLNVDLQESLRRLSKRKPVPGNDRFENAETLAKVKKGYADVPKYGVYPEDIYLQINSTIAKALVYKNVITALADMPKLKNTFFHAICEKILENIDDIAYTTSKDVD